MYYDLSMTISAQHPLHGWRRQVAGSVADLSLRLRLAAMTGHVAGDRVASRRAALVDLLADGRPHTREDIWARISAELGKDCWGLRPDEALLRDLNTLRRGGIRIAYSRTKGVQGYYLEFPPIVVVRNSVQKQVDPCWLERLRAMDVPEKNAVAFAAAEAALEQKRLLLAEGNPTWSKDEVDREGRRLVFAVKQ